MEKEIPFGGKVLILGGDFRQTLPVLKNSSPQEVIENCLLNNSLWHRFQKQSLSQNMRVSNDINYENWLLKVGNVEVCNTSNLNCDKVEVDPIMVCNGSIVDEIYRKEINMNDLENPSTKAILSPTNKDVQFINDQKLKRIPGESRKYYSIDKVIDVESVDKTLYTDEFIHQQTPSGTPPHILKLKTNSIVMLIRNLDSKNGLCNGTRLIIKKMNWKYLDVEILTGTNIRKRAFIPRITLVPSDTNLFFTFSRKQFPVIPAFAMTISKSQGQIFNKVGIHLDNPVFSHGMLYTALSRCRSKDNIKIFISDSEVQGRRIIANKIFVHNVVFKKIYKI